MWSRMKPISSEKVLHKCKTAAVCLAALIMTVTLGACRMNNQEGTSSQVPKESVSAVSEAESTEISQVSETVSRTEESKESGETTLSDTVSVVSGTESGQIFPVSEEVSNPERSSKTESSGNSEAEEADDMKMFINGQRVNVSWENNGSVEALKELAAISELQIEMSMYGGFEQVGSLGTSLPREDAQTTTKAGDIVLYSGDQLVVFYGSNSWAYTGLGHITDKTADELTELLGNGNVTVTLTMTESRRQAQ